MIDEREEENGEECIPVETGEAFWKAINRGEVVEPGRELGERIGLMEEDAGGEISSSGSLHLSPTEGPIRSRTHQKEGY